MLRFSFLLVCLLWQYVNQTRKKDQGGNLSNLDLLIQAADSLSKNLEIAAENEKMFCHDLCLELERYSWEVFKMSNGIRELREHYGVCYEQRLLVAI